MGKSRYSKTKAAGKLCGMSRYKKQFELKTASADLAVVENRQLRRLRKRENDGYHHTN